MGRSGQKNPHGKAHGVQGLLPCPPSPTPVTAVWAWGGGTAGGVVTAALKFTVGVAVAVYHMEKENRRLKKENDFLEEASAFFAASRLKSANTKE